MTDRDQLRRLLADTASLPGRWHWAGNAKHHTVTLSTWVPGYGRVDVLSCRRAGMHGAEFRFCDPDSMMLQPVRELVQYEVCHAATSPDDPRVYRHDIDDVRHPDARLIVAAVNALPGLLDALDAAEAEVERLRAGITALAGGWVHNGHPDTEGEPECPGCWAADLRALLDGTTAESKAAAHAPKCKGAPVTQEPAPVARRGASNWSKREDSTWIDKL